MKSLVCVDASLIVWALVPAPLSEAAATLLERWQQEQVALVAPALLAFEVTSSLRRAVYLKEITPDEGEDAFEKFSQLNIRLSHRKSIFPLAWKLAKEFNRPRAYDTAYLALAQLYDCEFWTADKKLYNAVNQHLPYVKWVGNYEAI